MKGIAALAAIAVMGAAGAVSAAAQQSRSQENPTVVRLQDSGAALVNPGMGWVYHHYNNNILWYGLELEPSDTLDDFPGMAIMYLRLAWSYLEPEEGKFNWSIVDTVAQRWVAKGRQVAFRFTCSESDREQPYATPEWVRKAGAKGHYWSRPKSWDTPGTPTRSRKTLMDSVRRAGFPTADQMWEPDFDDPIFLEKLDHFLAAAAARYDGNPEVAFIDVGSFGVWGEGHTIHSSRVRYPSSTVIRHTDLYKKHFKKTLLAAQDDFANPPEGRGDLEAIYYARDQGLTLRDDSILIQTGKKAYLSAFMAPLFWGRHPVILETAHYGTSRDRGDWQDGSKVLEAIEQYHASYVSAHWYPREYLEECRPLIDKINRRLGYRLQLVEASWPPEVTAESKFTFGYQLRNAGVAPCVPGGAVAVTLKDQKGGIAGVFADERFSMRSLPVGPPGEAEVVSRQAAFVLPYAHIVKPGTYELYVSVGSRTGTPRIALPLPNDDGQHRYRLGTMRITSRPNRQ